MLKDFLNEILTDVEVDLTQEFDRNFERKAFFNNKWPQAKHANSRGSLLMRTGKLRRSVQSNRANGRISWSSNLPYASIQNEGGEIVVTAKMKSFFGRCSINPVMPLKEKANVQLHYQLKHLNGKRWHF
ncbi:hypothetical protein PL373_18995 [Tenacibaculum maritimum]|nr:hypothetical protein [Tenacibaculum maritimum]